MTEEISKNADIVEAILHQMGPFRARYDAKQQEYWDHLGWTLGDRDRAIEQLIAQGRVTLQLRPGGVGVSLVEPEERPYWND